MLRAVVFRKALPVSAFSKKMAPIEAVGDLPSKIKDLIEKNRVMIFSKTTCPFCKKVSQRL